MAIVPQPNTPNVSKSQAGPSISGDALAAPGRALQGVSDSLNYISSDLTQRRIRTKEAQAKLEKETKEAQEKLEKEIYEAGVRRSKHKINSAYDVMAETVMTEIENAAPESVYEIYDAIRFQFIEDAEAFMEGLNEIDLEEARSNLADDLAVFDSKVKTKYVDRVAKTDISIAKYDLERSYLRDDPLSQEKVANAEALIKKHYPSPKEHEPMLKRIKSDALMSKTIIGMRSANNLDDIQALKDELKSYQDENLLDDGQLVQADNETRGALARVIRKRSSFIRNVQQRTATPEERDEAIALRIVSEDELSKLDKDLLLDSRRKDNKALMDRFRNNEWKIMFKEIQGLISDADTSNPKIMYSKMAEIEAIIDKGAPNSVSKAYAQSQVSTMLAGAVQGEDDSFAWLWGDSFHHGELIEQKVPNNLREDARGAYANALSELAIELEKGGNYNIPMGEVFTNLENDIAIMFSKQAPSERELRELIETTKDGVIEELVRDAIENPKSNSFSIPQRLMDLEAWQYLTPEQRNLWK